jgi:hypothetical protein
MKLLVLIFLTSLAHAQEWRGAENDFQFLNENLEYSNRAFCAKRASSPTKKVFLLLDNVNIAKAVFRLAKIKNIDPVETTNLAIDKFRYTLTKLVSLISDRLMAGTLPLVEESDVSFSYLKDNWQRSMKFPVSSSTQCWMVKKLGSLHSYLNVSRPDQSLLEQIAKDLGQKETHPSKCEDISVRSSSEVALYRFNIPDTK